MAFVSPRMSLKVWNSAQDPYSHEQLADNFLKLDQHDHSLGKGTIITGAGIADGSIEARHIFPGTLSPALISSELDGRYLAPYVTVLPGSPVDGQEVIYGADAANGVMWHLRYRSAGVTNKWEFIGGAPLVHEVVASYVTGAGTNADTTSGPTLTVPLAGVYDVEFGFRATAGSTLGINTTVAVTTSSAFNMSGPDILDAVVVQDYQNSANPTLHLSKTMRRTYTASTVLRHRQSSQYSATLRERYLYLRPVKVG